LSWTVPTADGGSAITGYVLTPSSGSPVSLGAGVTTYTVTGLTNGTPYTFTIAAVNAVGAGAASVVSAAATPAPVVPDAPTAVIASAGDGHVMLGWIAPVDDGGSPITGYVITPSAGSPITVGDVTTYAVPGLTNGTSYTFTVAAVNAVGTGVDSAASSATTPTATRAGGATAVPAPPARIAGANRLATAVATSVAELPTGHSAGAVVLARADNYPDALVGIPLAKAKDAPLLLVQGTALDDATTVEIERVLAPGGTVYLLGGTTAIPANVASEVTALGYVPVRYAGADRFGTALAVAEALGDPSTVLLATGMNFPDALAAGPAASHVGGAVLLTDNDTLPPSVAAYLAARATKVYAIGGSAVAADRAAVPIAGADRYATAARVASTLFETPTVLGIASGVTYPDALTGGALEAHDGGPVVLSLPESLPTSTTEYLQATKSSVVTSSIFGGIDALSSQVQDEVNAALGY
jgi:putative cell wall-binding protein